MPKLTDRISDLETKLKALKVRQQRIDARARALASNRARKEDTRRKILIGATVLARIDAHLLEPADLKAWLSDHLTREDDRALFELPPKAAPAVPN
jgi:hypothetical protein